MDSTLILPYQMSNEYFPFTYIVNLGVKYVPLGREHSADLGSHQFWFEDKPVTFNSHAHISWQIKLMNQKSIRESERRWVRFLKNPLLLRQDASRISCLIWIFPTRFKVMYFPISTLVGYYPIKNVKDGPSSFLKIFKCYSENAALNKKHLFYSPFFTVVLALW